MKYISTHLCALLILTGFCSASSAMQKDVVEDLTVSLAETSLTPVSTRTEEEQVKLNNDLYTACKGADPVVEGQPRVVDLSRVTELLDQGADINTRGIGFNTPLHVACSSGFENLVDVLLGYNNIRIDAQNDKRFSALYMASGNGFEGIVRKLLGKGANPELQDVNGISALHSAVQFNRLGTATLLIDAGAIVDSPNNEGVRPIHTALHAEPLNLDLDQLLLSNKSDLSKPDDTSVTPLNIIFTSKNIDLHLLIINADVNEDVRRAFEPFLLYAMFCVNKDIRISQALLAYCA